MRDRFFRPDLVAAACALFAFAARAEDVIYGPDGAPTVVQRKLHTMSGKWEAGVAFDVALNTALVDQLGGVLGVSYHPNGLQIGMDGFDWDLIRRDFVEMKRRLDEAGVSYRLSEVPSRNQRQIFFKDPTGSGVELQFAAGDG